MIVRASDTKGRIYIFDNKDAKVRVNNGKRYITNTKFLTVSDGDNYLYIDATENTSNGVTVGVNDLKALDTDSLFLRDVEKYIQRVSGKTTLSIVVGNGIYNINKKRFLANSKKRAANLSHYFVRSILNIF